MKNFILMLFTLSLLIILCSCSAQTLEGDLTFKDDPYYNIENGEITISFSYGSESGNVSSFHGIAQIIDNKGTVYHTGKGEFSCPNKGQWYNGDLTFTLPAPSSMPSGNYPIRLSASSSFNVENGNYYPAGTTWGTVTPFNFAHTGVVVNSIAIGGISDESIVFLDQAFNWSLTVGVASWVDFTDTYTHNNNGTTHTIHFGNVSAGNTSGTYTINDEIGLHSLYAEVSNDNINDEVVVCALEEWDSDNDRLSVATETNSSNLVYNFQANVVDDCPSCAVGDYNNGSLTNGINLTDNGVGYTHYPGADLVVDTDDWGTCETVELIEYTGREWFCWESSSIRMQVGDLSLQDGGPFYSPLRSHQNGLDFDVRYVRTDGEGECNLAQPNDLEQFDKEATIELINILVNSNLGTNYEVAKIIIDIENYSELQYDEYLLSILPEGTVIGVNPDHTDHFHVRLKPYTCP